MCVSVCDCKYVYTLVFLYALVCVCVKIYEKKMASKYLALIFLFDHV